MYAIKLILAAIKTEVGKQCPPTADGFTLTN